MATTNQAVDVSSISSANPDNATAIQAAVDSAASTVASILASHPGSSPLAKVVIPASPDPYVISSPIFLDSKTGIEISSDGVRGAQGAVFQMAPGCSYPMFVTGLSRSGNQPGASYRPDLFGKLDSVTSANQRFGFRTNKDGYIWSDGSSLSHGANSRIYNGQPTYYFEDDYLTVDFFIEMFPEGQSGALFGMYGSDYPGPWFVSSTGSGFQLDLSVQSKKFGPTTKLTYTFPCSANPARVTFSVDLDKLRVIAWVNGIQVAVTGPPIPQGSRLAEVNDQTWNLNASGYQCANLDFAIYGLCASNSPKYADRGVGNPQVPNPAVSVWSDAMSIIYMCPTGGTWTIRHGTDVTPPLAWDIALADLQTAICAIPSVGAGNVTVTGIPGRKYQIMSNSGFSFGSDPGMADGSNLVAAISDTLRYTPYSNEYGGFQNADPSAFAFFTFAEPPGGRHLSIAGPNAIGQQKTSAFILNQGSLDPIASRVRFSGVGMAGGAYGAPLTVCHSLEHDFDNVSISGGLWAWSTLPYGANYPMRFDRCQLSGNDGAIKAFFSNIFLTNSTLSSNGRIALRLRACNATVRDCIVAATGTPQYAFAAMYDGVYGGKYTFDNVEIDNEGVPYEFAGFYAERHAYTWVSLKVKDCYLGQIGEAPVFKLDDQGVGSVWPPASLKAEDVMVDTTGAVIEVNGPGWSFETTGIGTDGGEDVIHRKTYPGRIRGVVVGNGKLPDKSGSTVTWTSSRKNLDWTDGQFAEFRSAGEGVWGSTKPPSWVGINPLQVQPGGSLAAYILDHTCISSSINGVPSSRGFLTDYACSRIAQWLFGGQKLPSVSWSLGFSTAKIRRDGQGVQKPPGSQKIALPNSSFSPSNSGTKVGTVPSSSQGNFKFKSAYLSDASGNVWAMIEWDKPQVYSQIAAINFAHVPIGGPIGSLTDYGWGCVFDAMFGATPANPRWSIGLTTTPSNAVSNGTEPSSNLYSRSQTGSWSVEPPNSQRGDVENTTAIPFSTKGNFTAVGVLISDQSGNAWFQGPLARATVVEAGSSPQFAPGSLYIGI